MSFLKSKLRFGYFLVFIISFVVNFSYSQVIDKTNFRIDTLRAFYTSGVPPFQIKGSVYLSFKIPAGKVANLLMKTNPTGSYSSLGTFGNASSIQTQRISTTIQGLNVRDDIYCYYLELINGASTLVTKELCSIPFTNEAAVSVNNRIVFQVGSYQPGTEFQFQTFRPFISGTCESAPSICNDDIDDFATNTKTVAPYRARKEYNSIVKCGEVKIFQVKIDIDGMISISDTIRNIGYTKQIPPILIEDWAYTTVENDKVKLVWKNDETINDITLEKRFIIERKDGQNGAYFTLPQSPLLERKPGILKFSWEFVDLTSDPSNMEHFYRIKYEDYCANISPAIDVAPIFLKQDAGTFELLWNTINNDKVVDYEVEFFDIPSAEPRKTLLILPKANKYKAETSNYYRIRGKQVGGEGSYIYSNFIPNNENLSVQNPNVFTPDNKGPSETETFKVTSLAAYTFYIAIYDRNGLLVYFSDNYQAHRKDGWNGKLIYTDIDMPEGIYAFQVEVTNSNHRNFTKRGSVLLIRN
ncbi:MAG: gliding motility-associated C-terminal domain-containing protein [Bacteroidota bacterium]